jgi:hypothetical protein
MNVPYERVVAYLVGPLSALIAWGATSLVHATVSKATAVTAATFVLTAAATALGHWKWLSNLAKWWDSQQNPATSPVVASEGVGDMNQGPPLDDAPERTRTPVIDVPDWASKPKRGK